jgi:hypothetical protein
VISTVTCVTISRVEGIASIRETGTVQLTAERRRELLDLLDDEARLQVEFPAVAEYLRVSPGLQGTGDPTTDADFELRFLHFMTAGNSVQDPYWKIVGALVQDDGDRRILAPEGSPRLAYAQMLLQQTFAYAILSPETVRWVREIVAGRTLIEIGAGNGYWAAQLASAGVRISAFDSHPPDIEVNPSFPQAGTKTVTAWHDVHHARSLLEASSDNRDSVLLMCWPPGWEDTMSSDALDEFAQSGGKRLIYIGEPPGGKTGNSAFFSALTAHWRLESVDSQYVRWWNLDDHAQAWVKN